MGIGATGRLNQFIDDVARRGAVGIAHAHIDDVLAATARRHLQFRRDVENVRRQALDAGKLSHLTLLADKIGRL
jgi:hypothetical protein